MTVCVYLYKHHLYTYILVWTWCLRSSCECNSLNLWAAFLCVLYINTKVVAVWQGLLCRVPFNICVLYCVDSTATSLPCIESNVCITRIITNVWGCEISQFSGLGQTVSLFECQFRSKHKSERYEIHILGLLNAPLPIYIGKMCARSFILVFWVFLLFEWLAMSFYLSGIDDYAENVIYESSGVDFFWILFHQYSRLLQFALDDRRNKNFSGVGGWMFCWDRNVMMSVGFIWTIKKRQRKTFFGFGLMPLDQHHLLFWLPLPQNSAVVCVFYTSSS